MLRKLLTIFSLLALLLLLGGYYRNGLKSKPKLNQQVTGIAEFRDLCRSAANDEHEFAQFKHHPIYTLFFENVTAEEGRTMIERIQAKAPDLLTPQLLEKYRTTDQIGKPTVFSYDQLGSFSPATLRYLKIIADLRDQFGSLDGLHIIEIGGGHGSLCKLIHDVATPASYTLINNADTLALAKKTLQAHGLNQVHFIAPEALKKGHYDLVISDYGFTESSKTLQQRYFSHILNQAERGYLTCNFFAKHYRVRPLSREKLLHKLSKQKPSLTLAEEEPATGPENFVALWGGGQS
jgi:putative sugar O-methyltransferase